jgi:hypothetical protein
MHLYFDESGDFGFPENRLDCYVQAGVICADSQLTYLDDFVRGAVEKLGVAELHGAELQDRELLAICRSIRTGGCVLIAAVTDTDLVTPADIARFRVDQAAAIQRSWDRFLAQGGESTDIGGFSERNMKRSAFRGRISDNEFVHAIFMIDLLRAALQKAVLWYRDERWAKDLAGFDFTLDRKGAQKLTPGEKFMSEILAPAIASRGEGFDVPDTWGEAHPFRRQYGRRRGRVRGVERKGVIDIKAIFEGSLHFQDSRDQAGLQLADIVAHVTRRAVLEPANAAIQAAYDCLRDQLAGQDGRCLIINRFRGSHEPTTLNRYMPLYLRRSAAA